MAGFITTKPSGLNQSLPVTVFLGGPPALILAAIAPLPEDVPELVLASLLVRRKTEDDREPARAATSPRSGSGVCTRWSRAAARTTDLKDRLAIITVTTRCVTIIRSFTVDAVFHRRDAIYPATVVGKPRQEDFFIGDYLQRLLSPLFPLVMPSVRDLWTYGETGFHSLCAAVVRERYGREALVSGFRILGEGQLSLTKFLILTDTPQDLKDFPRLLEHVLERFRPETDLFVFSNVSMDTLDYTSGKVNEGSKAIMLGLGDAVRKLPT